MPDEKFRVVIAGGGVCGLTLANALERAGIDYVLLEARAEIAPALGASIAISANGFRILDQLGCFEAIDAQTIPFDHLRAHSPDGDVVYQVDAPLHTRTRFGYPFSFMDRQFLLQTLHNNLKDKSKVLLGKKVSRVDNENERVTVHCKDGTSFKGDVVVGSDGTYSTVRQEMWRYISDELPALVQKEKSTMTATYRAIYGMSKPTDGFVQGYFNSVLGYDTSFLYTTDKSGRVFWFLFEKLDKKYRTPDIPRFSNADAEVLAHRYLDVRLSKTLKFADLWSNRTSFTLVALEEGWYERWTWGRIVCAGDSIHKWTPNIGQGGNHAIESAAVLANALNRLATMPKRLSPEVIQTELTKYHKRRSRRAKAAFKSSLLATRIEALATRTLQFLVFRVLPRAGEYINTSMALSMVGAEAIEFLPYPPRSFTGTMGFHSATRKPRGSVLTRRAPQAFPLLLLAFLAHRVLSTIVASPELQSDVSRAVGSGRLQFANDIWSIPIDIEPLNILVTVFAPSLLNIDPQQRIQTISFLMELTPLWLVMILESHRRANVWKFVTAPILFGVAFQLFGIGAIGPLWFFLHYLQSPLHDYASYDWRLVDLAAAKTALPVVLVVLTFPTLAMFFLPNLDQRLAVNAVWQGFPLWMSLLHYLLRTFAVKNTTKQDRLWNVKADLPYLRYSVMVSSAMSAMTFNWARWTSGQQIATVVFPQWTAVAAALRGDSKALDLVSGMRLFLQVDEVACFAGAFLWLALLIYDLKKEDMTKVNWLKVMAIGIVGTYFVGPGAVTAATWLWREEILASRKLKGVVVRQT